MDERTRITLMRGSRARRPLALAVMALLPLVALAVPGCNIITPIAYIVQGPGTIDAEFIPEKTSTVIFVDDRSNLLPRTVMRSQLGDTLGQLLVDRGVISEVVSTRDAIALVRQRERGDKPMSIAAIGRTLGVNQVIYVEISSFALVPNTGLPQPTATGAIKVLDLVRDVRAFPPEGTMQSNRPVTSVVDDASPELYRSASGRRALEDLVIAQLAIDISKLFYEHDRIDLGGNLERPD